MIRAGAALLPIENPPYVRCARDIDIIFSGDGIDWVGHADQSAKVVEKHGVEDVIDASSSLITPGLIDCHTHAVFAGSRSDEFFQRLSGSSYEEISKKGGGIHKTVRETRSATDAHLMNLAKQRLDRFLGYGVTTIESKSGYGLSLDHEIRLLSIMNSIVHVVDIIPTFLGAHLIPQEYQNRRDEYVRLVCEEMLPQVKLKKLSNICDVFCDPHAFSVTETEVILQKASALGFQIKLHADQLSSSGGAELAAKFQALSADHLDHISVPGMEKMASANTVGVMVPSCSVFLGKKHQAPARNMISKGMRLAISTDCNPGTSNTTNLLLGMSLAATEMKLSCEEIWAGVTVHAARALGLDDRGSIASRKKADLCLWDTTDPRDIPYQFGSAAPSVVFKNGEQIPTRTAIGK